MTFLQNLLADVLGDFDLASGIFRKPAEYLSCWVVCMHVCTHHCAPGKEHGLLFSRPSVSWRVVLGEAGTQLAGRFLHLQNELRIPPHRAVKMEGD